MVEEAVDSTNRCGESKHGYANETAGEDADGAGDELG